MFYSLLALLHALALAAGAALGVRRLSLSVSHKFLAGFLLVWFNLVITGYALSLFTKLNSLPLYFTVSCLLSGGTALLLDRMRSINPAAPGRLPEKDERPFSFSPLMKFGLAVLAVAVIGSAVIAVFYYPNNPDSVAYRFARVFLYLGKGNLMHPAHNDPRISFYPFNGALAYLYCAIYQLDGRWFNFPGYIAWIASALGVYVLGRDLGASREGSFRAGWIYALSPIVLVLATSTNDDLMAAAPVLIGLIFFHRWWYTGTLFDALLGGIGVGLGAGTKLHIVFFWPVAVCAAVWLLITLVRKKELAGFLKQRAFHIVASGFLAALLALPFLVVNMVETKEPILPKHFTAPLMNKPFSPKVAGINVSLFTAQLFLAQIPELVVIPHPGLKGRIYGQFNDFFNRHLFPWLDKNDHYSCEPYYYFRGIASPFGWWTFEETEWLGSVPFLALFGMLLLPGLRTSRARNQTLWLLTAFFAWHLYKSATMKYIEAASAYYSYPFAICAAGLALLWDLRRDMKKYAAAVISALFALVIVTHSLLALNLLTCNVRRNLTSLVLTQFSSETIQRLPFPSVVVNALTLAQRVDLRVPVPDTVLKTLNSAENIHLVYTRWEFPFFHFMSGNPAARYTSSSQIVEEENKLNILLYPARSEFAQIPVRIGDGKARLTGLGALTTELGTEYVFGRGDRVHTSCPGSSGFIVLQPSLKYAEDGARVSEVTFSPAVVGVDENDHFEYRLSQISADGEEHPVTDWFQQSQLEQVRKLPMPAGTGYLKVQVRLTGAPNNIFGSLLPLKKGEDITPPNVTPDGVGLRQL